MDVEICRGANPREELSVDMLGADGRLVLQRCVTHAHAVHAHRHMHHAEMCGAMHRGCGARALLFVFLLVLLVCPERAGRTFWKEMRCRFGIRGGAVLRTWPLRGLFLALSGKFWLCQKVRFFSHASAGRLDWSHEKLNVSNRK
jgi:hypothetical protein